MSSRLLNFSLGLNLLLLGVVGYWVMGSHSKGSTSPISQKNLIDSRTELAPSPLEVASAPSLRWNEIESEDYPTYVANLRKVGCPEPVLRRIIEADLKELYAQKAFAVAREFHRDFWQIAAGENVREYFARSLGQQVRALCQTPSTVLKELIGEAPHEPFSVPITNSTENWLTDFLSASKQEQLRQLAERYEARLQAVRDASFSPEEKEVQLAQLRREMESEQTGMLSPQELAEYHLRQSGAVKEVQQLYGVDFSETELRKLAQAIDDYHHQTETQDETDPETLEQKLLALLGPDRFAELNRARAASYREIYEVTSDFNLPSETAVEIFDLRLAAEKRCDEIRADKNWPVEEKQALLDELQEQVEQTALTKFGAEAYQSYKARHGRWINALGRR